MSRSFDDILAEVSAKSDPQRQLVLKQISDIPTQLAADESALGAKKDQAYEDIVSGARRRGLGFSGIPLGEQAKYNATDYAPALANTRTSYNNRQTTLESALADIGRSDYGTAQDVFGRDRAFEEQQRQFNDQMALQREQQRLAASQNSALASLYGGGASQAGGQTRSVGNMVRKTNGGGYAFTDPNNNSISAAKYAQLNGLDIGDVLRQMGQQGDAYAANAYNWLQKVKGMDAANSPEKLLALAQRNFSPLFWGL
jgi:hypothetical protein